MSKLVIEEPTRTGEAERGGEREQRLSWFFASRLDVNGKFRPGLIAQGSKSRHQLQREQPPPAPPGGAGTVNWTPIGPSVVARGQATGNPPVSGRITGIAVGPGATRLYAGAANGGVWFSGDGGVSWIPLDDYFASPGFTSAMEEDSLSVGAIAVSFGATVATDAVYAGTGEPGPSDGYFGVGIRRSASGGAPGTWTLEGTNLASKGIYRLVIDPDNPAVVYAATTGGLYRRPAAAPFTTWAQVTSAAFTNVSGQVSDLVVTGSAGTKKFYAAFSSDRVYSSPDGVTWTALTGIPIGAGRIALAAGESAPTIYAFIQNGTLLRLVGTGFQTVAGVPSATIVTTQGWYDLVAAVDPASDSTVYLAGSAIWDGTDYNQPLFKGTITGGPGTYTFPFNAANAGNPTADPTWVGVGVHADAHSFAFALNMAGTAHDPTSVWIGTDGGLFGSIASGAAGSFKPRNTGLAITEMTYLAQRPDTDAVVFAGCQDNGNLRCWGEPAWFESPEGDGGGVAIDPNDQYRVMRQYVRAGFWFDNPALPPGNLAFFAAGLYTATDGGASGSWPGLNFPPITAMTTVQKTAANTENSATGFYGPIEASPSGVVPTQVVFGTNRLWLSASDWGGSWVTLPTNTNPYVPATPNAAQDVLDGNPIRAIAFASGTRVFAATQNQVWRFDAGGGGWTKTAITTVGLPAGRLITDLAVDNAAAGTLYAALGGAGFNHLWYFDGAAWNAAGPAAGTLDVPCHAVAVDPANPNLLYLGSDVGCWKGVKTGPATWTWTLFSQGLPECAITDLEVHPLTRLLRAATHGRGIWEIQLDAVAGLDPDLYLRVDYADTGRLPGGARYPWVENHQDPSRKTFTVSHWMSPDVKVRRGSLPPVHALSSPPNYLDFAVNVDDYVDTSDIETADISGSNRIFIQVHNRALTPIPGAQVQVLLLLTDAAAGLPPLPANYAAHINAADTSNWVAGSSWRFADPVTPYRSVPASLDVRTPGIVEYQVDFSTLALPAGHDHVCAAAFVTTAVDQLVGGTPSMDQLTMQDKHAAHRNLHLVPAGTTPAPPGGQPTQDPQTILVDFWNASREEALIDLVFERELFPGRVVMLLPQLDSIEPKGWRVVEHGSLEAALKARLSGWLERVGELLEERGEQLERTAERLAGEFLPPDDRELKMRRLATLDRRRVYVATDSKAPMIGSVRLPAGGCITAALTVQAPDGAQPGDRFRFDVIQRRGGKTVGGSTYIVLVTKTTDARAARR